MMLSGGATIGELIGKIGSGTVHMFVAKPWSVETMRRMLERANISVDIQNRAAVATEVKRPLEGVEAMHMPR